VLPDDDREPTRERKTAIAPRGLDRESAAAYIGSSVDTIDRLINAGILPIESIICRAVARH
jgi:hypothetical protein